MSRETDSSSSGPNGRGGAAYPSGTPPYGTPTGLRRRCRRGPFGRRRPAGGAQDRDHADDADPDQHPRIAAHPARRGAHTGRGRRRVRRGVPTAPGGGRRAVAGAAAAGVAHRRARGPWSSARVPLRPPRLPPPRRRRATGSRRASPVRPRAVRAVGPPTGRACPAVRGPRVPPGRRTAGSGGPVPVAAVRCSRRCASGAGARERRRSAGRRAAPGPAGRTRPVPAVRTVPGCPVPPAPDPWRPATAAAPVPSTSPRRWRQHRLLPGRSDGRATAAVNRGATSFRTSPDVAGRRPARSGTGAGPRGRPAVRSPGTVRWFRRWVRAWLPAVWPRGRAGRAARRPRDLAVPGGPGRSGSRRPRRRRTGCDPGGPGGRRADPAWARRFPAAWRVRRARRSWRSAGPGGQGGSRSLGAPAAPAARRRTTSSGRRSATTPRSSRRRSPPPNRAPGLRRRRGERLRTHPDQRHPRRTAPPRTPRSDRARTPTDRCRTPRRSCPSRSRSPAPAAKRAKKKGRSKLVLLVVGVVVLGGVAYGAGLLMNHSDVPKGTTVLGVDIGGGTRDEAVKKLDDAFGDRTTKAAPAVGRRRHGRAQAGPGRAPARQPGDGTGRRGQRLQPRLGDRLAVRQRARRRPRDARRRGEADRPPWSAPRAAPARRPRARSSSSRARPSPCTARRARASTSRQSTQAVEEAYRAQVETGTATPVQGRHDDPAADGHQRRGRPR